MYVLHCVGLQRRALGCVRLGHPFIPLGLEEAKKTEQEALGALTPTSPSAACNRDTAIRVTDQSSN